jgi:serine/threonine-protein kinase
MTIEYRRRLFTILRELVDSTEPSSPARLLELCDGDEALAAEVRALLREQASDLLDANAVDVAGRLIDANEPTLPDSGASIGGWRIEREIGRGGMGTVFLAERSGDGYVQQGALKLIRRGMDSDDVLARFRAERRILASLAHPHTARLLDGGISEDGRPYFVMEYVAGETLRQWVARTHVGLDARIGVFLQLCEAVAHAHQRLIVHRDIKPENVLVDEAGQARLLDFGIAKLLEADDTHERTATARRFVSRAYAAPEQIAGAGATTMTDVYQLGVLLFELLTGTRFSARPSGSASSWLARVHAEADAATRQAIPAHALRGDAGIIVARATDAEPLRRYATVEAFADDVKAWRAGRPIKARLDTAAYRLNRFVGRHRVASALAALAAAAVLAGSVLALWQARKAAAEARLARSAQTFLTSVFDASRPDAAAGERVTARELLDRGSERIEHELADQPRLRGEMQLTLGTLYRELGQYPQAEHLLDGARTTLAEHAPGSESATRAQIEFATVERELGKLDESERALIAALSLEPEPKLQAHALAERGLLREKQQHFDQGLADARAALAIDLARGESALADQSRDRQVEALLLARRGEFDESARTFEQAIADARKLHGGDDTRIAQMRNDYGVALVEKGRPKEAEAELRQALDLRRKRLGNDHPSVAESLQVLGAALRGQNRMDEAQAALEDALRIQRATFGDHHALVANTLNSLGMLRFSRRQPADAEPYFRESVAIYRDVGQADSSPGATAANNLATVLIQLGRYDEAEPLMRHALEVHLGLYGEQHPVVMSDLNTFAQLEMRRDHFESAIDYARRAVRIADSASSPAREGAYVHLSFANVLNRAGHADEALNEVDGAIAALERIDAGKDPRMPVARAMRADALLRLGRVDEAHELATKVLAERTERMPGDIAGLAATHALLARVADAHKRSADAVRERDSARTLLAKISAPDPDLRRQIER